MSEKKPVTTGLKRPVELSHLAPPSGELRSVREQLGGLQLGGSSSGPAILRLPSFGTTMRSTSSPQPFDALKHTPRLGYFKLASNQSGKLEGIGSAKLRPIMDAITPRAFLFDLGEDEEDLYEYDYEHQTPVVERLDSLDFPPPPAMATQASVASQYSTTMAATKASVAKYPAWRRYATLLGGVCSMLVAGFAYSFGNLAPYLASYIAYNDKHITYDTAMVETNIVWSVNVIALSSGCIMGGYLDVYFGPKIATYVSALMIVIGITVAGLFAESVYLLCLGFAVIYGLGRGALYGLSVACTLAWWPGKEGIVTGIVMAAFGGGPALFSQIETQWVNHGNYPLSPTNGYLDSPSVVTRVPTMFYIIAATCAVLLLPGILFFSTPELPQQFQTPRTRTSVAPGASSGHSSPQRRRRTKNVKPSHGLRMPRFWLLLIIEFTFSSVMLFYVQGYKALGNSFLGITNDAMLSIIGSFGGLTAGLARVFWGVFYDCVHQNFGLAMLVLTILQGGLSLTLTLIPMVTNGNEAALNTLAMIWLCGLFFCNGFYCFLPDAIRKYFGPKYRSAYIGMIFLAEVPASFCDTAILGGANTWMGGWQNVLITLGCCSAVCCMLSLVFDLDFQPFVRWWTGKGKDSGFQSVSEEVTLKDAHQPSKDYNSIQKL